MWKNFFDILIVTGLPPRAKREKPQEVATDNSDPFARYDLISLILKSASRGSLILSVIVITI